MKISDLKPGAVFVECDETEWASLTKKEKGRTPRATFDRFLGLCHDQPQRVHVRTSKGDWCIPDAAPVTVVHVYATSPQENAA